MLVHYFFLIIFHMWNLIEMYHLPVFSPLVLFAGRYIVNQNKLHLMCGEIFASISLFACQNLSVFLCFAPNICKCAALYAANPEYMVMVYLHNFAFQD